MEAIRQDRDTPGRGTLVTKMMMMMMMMIVEIVSFILFINR